ncbi:hypothetical protein A7Q09_06015 [Methylacidiphilum sp. Yel]|uniref:class I SAM-dependent methyltransferase n=1 Tax=Methylacidiphilum sp. Yel TaxID=1847730 RepID=UPI00106B8FEE|nr:class I SAM-dependent methyltransferase [Methylacidiphilum sp. Yel]TFE69139.1 hypothetical protein A7Q09_06015 [Methylacidiphilum sp. Yel]
MSNELLREAAAIWDDPNESMESVEARIHDGVPKEKLTERADSYVNVAFNLFPYIQFPTNGVVLEIGSGLGYIMEALHRALLAHSTPPQTILGLDIAKNMIAKAEKRLQKKPPFCFLHYDGVNIPLPDQSIDLIFSVAALQHIPKPYVYNLFFEIKRLLKPLGFVVFQIFSFQSFVLQEMNQEKWYKEIKHQITGGKTHWHYFYAREELEIVLRHGTGFSSVDVRDGGGSYWTCAHSH